MNLNQDSAEPLKDRRHDYRVSVSIPGRYMLEDRREFPCRTVDFSSNGVCLALPVRGKQGERVVVYLDYIGRIEGIIIRDTPLGFALALTHPANKREKIADQLTYLLNREHLGKADRRHDRIVPNLRHAILHLSDGREHLVKLIDISVSGAAIGTQLRLPMNEKVRLGAREGSIIRHFESGMAVEFSVPIPIESFNENIRL
jgi:hypothetical protein